jgi:flagellar hook-associated protein 2
MAGTISFGGIGSGMDTEGIVQGLVGASQGTLSSLKSRASATSTAVSTLSNIGSLLSTLKKAADGLANVRDVGSFKATSSSTAIAVSANGTALPSAYKVEVLGLAKEQRNYTSTFASTTTALGQAGTLGIQVGSGEVKNVSIGATDTLDQIAGKINASGARVSASVFYDGTSYRLQVRGLDTGAANAVTYTEGAGVNLGLNAPGSLYQSAANASVRIDDIPVSSATNQVVGAIQGVTLALTEQTTTPIQIKVENDPKGLETKLKAVVDAYNAVISKIQETAGTSSVKGTNPVLSSDSGLRSITASMSNAVLARVTGAGTYETLSSIGLSLGKDGKLSIDAVKLDKAISTDATSVAAVLAGPESGKGAMDVLGEMIQGLSAEGTGVLALRKEALESRAKSMNERVNREQDRLDRYADMLRKQFTRMDTTVSANNAQLSYLASVYSGR